jgi:hypothetical protein
LRRKRVCVVRERRRVKIVWGGVELALERELDVGVEVDEGGEVKKVR